MEQSEIIKKITEYCIRNRHQVIGWGSLSESDREHVYNIALSVYNTREKICFGGSFVTAICKNDLRTAVSNADDICKRCLLLFVHVYHYFHS
jgi:hypothetical protein